jgi:hypothetical protein
MSLQRNEQQPHLDLYSIHTTKYATKAEYNSHFFSIISHTRQQALYVALVVVMTARIAHCLHINILTALNNILI